MNKRHMIQSFSISSSTLLNITKELDEGIIKWNKQVKQSKRLIMKSEYINKSIMKFIRITNHPYTARDVSSYLFSTHRIRVEPS